MGANRHQSALSANILMQFFLQVNETIIRILGEMQISQNCPYNVRPNSSSVRFYINFLNTV